MPNRIGLRAEYTLPKKAQKKELWVVISGMIRTNYAHSTAIIAVQTNSEDGQMLCWKALHLRYYFTDINKWCFFKDSIYLPKGYYDKAHSKIATFAFSGTSANENFDLDSLFVTIKQKI